LPSQIPASCLKLPACRISAGQHRRTPLRKNCRRLPKKFEGVLLHQMFKQAQQNIEQMDTDEDEESEDAGGEQIQSLYWSQMSDLVSEQGGMGLWKSIYRQIGQQMNLPADAAAGLNEGV